MLRHAKKRNIYSASTTEVWRPCRGVGERRGSQSLGGFLEAQAAETRTLNSVTLTTETWV